MDLDEPSRHFYFSNKYKHKSLSIEFPREKQTNSIIPLFKKKKIDGYLNPQHVYVMEIFYFNKLYIIKIENSFIVN